MKFFGKKPLIFERVTFYDLFFCKKKLNYYAYNAANPIVDQLLFN